MRKHALLSALVLLQTAATWSQSKPVTNLDEAQVKPYTLPDPLQMANGQKVSGARQWASVQRPYIYKLYEENVFGRYPARKIPVRYRLLETGMAMNGSAIRKQVRIYLHPTDSLVFVDLLMYLPASIKKGAPVFLGYNFSGNQTVYNDPAVFLSSHWTQAKTKGIVNNHGTDSSRGVDPGWQPEEMIRRGYGLATAHYSDIEPDHKTGWETGIRTTLKTQLGIEPQEWGAIGAWAWGLSRIMDYLEQDRAVDAKRVAVMGHSRLGKAALWAGASDPRFSLVVSNESGEGGAALSRRWYGETILALNTSFPYWFVPAFRQFNEAPERLPVDAHLLLSLIAPRPLYVASAVEDRWSDPTGEFLGAYHAGPVYALYGKKGLPSDSMPPVETPAGNTVHYHIRNGKHDVTAFDWTAYMNFADKYMK